MTSRIAGVSLFFAAAILNASAQPTISSDPRSVTANTGGAVTFSVTASGATKLRYLWKFNGLDLPDSNTNVLRITNAAVQHLGEYRAVVTSGAQSVTSQVARLSLFATINHEFNPRLTVQRQSNLVHLAWTGEGRVETAANLAGPWTDIPNIRTSYTAAASDGALFYRLRNPHPRTVRVFLPASYRHGTAVPFVLNLHGYTGTGQGHEEYFRIRPYAETNGFLYAYPDGVANLGGFRFWNAANACCDFDNQQIDDSGYVRSIILGARRDFTIDPKRVHLLGHSNGGFMSLRAAYDHPELIASVASLAGGMDRDPLPSPPRAPVHVLQIHGTADDVIFYNGGPGTAELPRISRRLPITGAQELVERWAKWNDCESFSSNSSPTLDLVSNLAGSETFVSRATNCVGAEVELWTIRNGSHGPSFTTAFARGVVEWLLAHPKRD